MAWVYIGAGLSTVALLVTLFYTLVTLQIVAQPSSMPNLTITVTGPQYFIANEVGLTSKRIAV